MGTRTLARAEPSIDAAKLYVQTLTGSVTTPMAWRVIRANDGPTHAVDIIGSLVDCWSRLLVYNVRGYGVYVGVQDMGGNNAANDHVAKLRACFIDCDSGDIDTNLIPRDCPPSFVVRSARGPHLYWLLDDDDFELFGKTQKGLIRHYKSDPHVHDLARVMRVPGLTHIDSGQVVSVAVPDTTRDNPYAWSLREIIEAHGISLSDGPAVVREPSARVGGKRDLAAAKAKAAAYKGVKFPGRNPEMYILACSLRDFGVIGQEAEDILRDVNQRNDPPLTDKELAKALKNSGKYAKGILGSKVPETMPQEDTSPSFFMRGDEKEVGEKLLRSIGNDIVYAQGHMWSYSHRDSVWKQIQTSRLISTAADFAGRPVVNARGDPRPLKMSHSFATGSVRLACASVEDDNFFSSGPKGAAFDDCFVSVEQGVFRKHKHNKNHRVTYKMPWKYSDNWSCPLFMRFLGEVFEGDVDSEDKSLLIQEFVGACLCGVATDYDKCLVFIGAGENGKGTLMNIISGLFDGSSIGHVSPSKWGQDYFLAKLAGKVINIVDELPRQKLDSSEIFKSVISGEPVQARMIYEKPFVLVSRAGHVFAGNELPPTTDLSTGFWRRFALIEFNRRFERSVGKNRTRRSIVAEIEPELGDVACWAMDGARRLVANGEYTIPESSHKAADEWAEECDSVVDFLRNACEPLSVELQYVDWSSGISLYENYKAWCQVCGRLPVKDRTFGSRAKKEVGLQRWNRSNQGVVYAVRYKHRLGNKDQIWD